MNKSQAKKKVFDYFKENAIEYKFVNEELKLIDVDSLDALSITSWYTGKRYKEWFLLCFG